MNLKIKKNKNKGFSLIELLVTCVLSVILLTLTIPAYQNFISTDRAVSQISQLVSAIHFARSEAIKRHCIVTLCKSANQKQCGGDWTQGWIVFVDKTGVGKVLSTQLILRVYRTQSSHGILKWQASRSDDYLQLSASGETRGQNGTFIYCSSGSSAYAVIVSQTGRVRVAKGENADGQKIVCSN